MLVSLVSRTHEIFIYLKSSLFITGRLGGILEEIGLSKVIYIWSQHLLSPRLVVVNVLHALKAKEAGKLFFWFPIPHTLKKSPLTYSNLSLSTNLCTSDPD